MVKKQVPYAICDECLLIIKLPSWRLSKYGFFVFSFKGNIYGRVAGNSIYYQVAWTSGTLVCYYSKDGSNLKKFGSNATYHDTYAECSSWTKGNPSYTITLKLNNRTFTTNETAAISNGLITGIL